MPSSADVNQEANASASVWLGPLIAVFALQVGGAMLTRVSPTLAPLIALQIGWSTAQVGYLTSLMTGGAAVFLLLGMPLLRRCGPLRALQLGLLLGGVGCVLLAFPAAFAALVGSMLIGIGYGPSSSAANDVLKRYAPAARQGIVFSIKQSGVPLGAALAGIVLPTVAGRIGLAAAVSLAGLLAITIVLAVQRLRARVDVARDAAQLLSPRIWLSPANLKNLSIIARTPQLRRAAAAGACLAVGQGCWVVYLVTYLVTDLNWNIAAAGAMFALMQAVSMGGRVLLGWLADRVGSTESILVGVSIVSVATTLAFATTTSAWPAWAISLIVIVAGGSVAAWNGVQVLQVARLAVDGFVAETTAAGAIIVFAGLTATPLIIGASIALLGSLSGGFMVAALITACAIPLLLFVPAVETVS
jgi:MFS family permease